VKNFLSNFEADYIIAQAGPKMGVATVGNGANARPSKQRTSKSGNT